MVVEHNWRSTWRRPLRAPTDAPLGVRCGDTMELDGSEPTIDIRPHLPQHPNGIRENERFLLEEPRKKVRRYDTTRPWESTQLRASTTSQKDKMRWKWDDVYLARGLTNMYSPSLSLPPIPLYLRKPVADHQWCTWRPWSGVLGDALGGRDRGNW